jgi:hypothetical protein
VILRKNLRAAAVSAYFFGQPPAGRFFWKDFFTLSSQLPSILRMSGFGPGLALGCLGFFAIAHSLPHRAVESVHRESRSN